MNTLKVGSLFSGVGGLDLAVESFFGAKTVWHCEFDPEPSKVLAARWPGVPNFGDVTAVDWSDVEPVDILCGGFPCQDLSLAGRRGGMRPGTRSGLWADFKTAIAALKPSVVVIENVRGLLSGCAESDLESCPGCVGDGEHEPVLRALGRVLGDLAKLGFDTEWGGLPASAVGAPHGRYRVFVLAYARGLRRDPRWDTASRQAAGGRASAVTGGRGGAPVALFPTITASEGEKGGPNQAHGGGDRTLSGVVTLLPTPVAQPSGNTPENHLRKKPGRQVVTDLAILVENDLLRTGGRLLPTPRASRGAAATETMYALGAERDNTGDRQGNVTGELAWGEYEPAVLRWEAITRPAPPPTLADGKNGNQRLAAVFPEWMMGYLAGWVTDILARNPAIKACGNGVVPQQAFAALGVLWSRVLEEVAA